MLIASLEVYGVHPDLVRAWEKAHGMALLPGQEEAVQRGVLSGRSLIVCAPTGSGKTFIGEMAAARAARQGRKVVCLAPTKALAEAKYEQFRRTYAPLGLRVVVTTRDRRSDDRAIERGDFDLLIAIPEKLRAMLSRAPALARQFGLVVADELQLLGDAHRGACYEALLADLHAASVAWQADGQGEPTQFVGLSAVLSNPEGIARWLGAEVVALTRRPVELRKGAVVNGVFSYSEHNTGQTGTETLLHELPLDDVEVLPALIRRFVRAGEGTIVFMRDKASCARLAANLAEALEETGEGHDAALTREAIESLEPSAVRVQLRRALQAGVAFHDADLQFPERRAVEHGFETGEVRVLCATSSLAMGVHLPARNVIVDPYKWETGPVGPGALRPVGRAEFENMAGRAGRPGYGDDFGRAIVLAETEYVASAFMDRYVLQPSEPVRSRLAGLPLTDKVLRVAGGVAALTVGVREAYGHTLAALEGGGWSEAEEATAERLHAAGLLARRPADGTWRATPLGRLCGASGLTFAGFSHLLRWARECPRAPGDLVTLAIAALCPDATDRLPLTSHEARGEELLRSFRGGLAPADCDAAERVMASEEAEPGERMRALKQALALSYWAGWEETEEVERSLRATAGRLSLVGESLGWLVQAFGEIGRHVAWPREDTARLERLAVRVSNGLPEEAAGLEALLREGVSRGRLLQLAREGCASLQVARESLRESGACAIVPEALPVPERSSAREPARQSEPASGTQVTVEAARPDRVIFRGAEVPVRPVEYKLMRCLAEKAGACVAYDDIYLALWGPHEMVQPSQVNWHNRRLVRKLAGSDAGALDGIPIRTIARTGLLLDLLPAQVTVT